MSFHCCFLRFLSTTLPLFVHVQVLTQSMAVQLSNFSCKSFRNFSSKATHMTWGQGLHASLLDSTLCRLWCLLERSNHFVFLSCLCCICSAVYECKRNVFSVWHFFYLACYATTLSRTCTKACYLNACSLVRPASVAPVTWSYCIRNNCHVHRPIGAQ